ncbi:N-acetyltransferase [Drechslerella dactyloides]|uniref:N-acetyltransferase n=1 Tax=Drechslerella dactyloides TaxID=74499 RepID=A0AAD6J2M4_DREDA|nr:N-acetyltransferase [Drechslerella dactyloides]
MQIPSKILCNPSERSGLLHILVPRVTPTTTSVLVVTSTSTTFVTHAQSDVLVTETHEAVVSSTSVVTESVDETITTTITSTSTTVPGSSCTQAPVPRDIFDPLAGGNVFRKRGGLPACCSACFLTSTKIAPRKTTTVTATQPKVTARITSTRTTTITSAVNLLANTETLFETSTSTFVSTSTITTTSTHTSTETTTVTALPPSLCGSPFTFNGNNAFSYTGTVASNDGDGITNISDCCTKCYTITNCANFMFDTNANTCTIFVMNSGTPSDRCVNDALREATASERLTLAEEYAMQRAWREDVDKLTFILCLPSPRIQDIILRNSEAPTAILNEKYTVIGGSDDTSDLLIGDVNLFLYEDDEGLDGEVPKGMVGEIEVMIARAEHQGQGLGKIAVLTFMLYVLRHQERMLNQSNGSSAGSQKVLKRLRVKIGKDNVKSLVLFQKLGFKRTAEEPNVFEEFELRLAVEPRDEVKAELRTLLDESGHLMSHLHYNFLCVT